MFTDNLSVQSFDPSNGRRHFLTHGLMTWGLVLVGCNTFAADEMNMSEHEHHHATMNTNVALKRSVTDYRVPTLKLVSNNGSSAIFPGEIDDGRPVILNFIYTSCTAVCPLTSQVFSQVQNMLGLDASKVHMMSISIDPEFDTPERLTAYAKNYNAGVQWQFYTGTSEASIAMQKAFGAYRGDKMNHIPLTFLRAAPGKSWVRLDGFANPDEVIGEFHRLLTSL